MENGTPDGIDKDFFLNVRHWLELTVDCAPQFLVRLFADEDIPDMPLAIQDDGGGTALIGGRGECSMRLVGFERGDESS